MSQIRKIIAEHMVYSKATSAHVTTVFEVDMTRVARLRQRAKAGFQRETGTKLTYMPFIFKAVCDALRKFPQLNASIDGNNIVYKKDVNLGMAVALDWGLIVPVIRNADELSLVGLAQHRQRPRRPRPRRRSSSPDEVHGGTFTITNPGRLRQPLRHPDHQPAAGRRSSASAPSRSGRWWSPTPTATTCRHPHHVATSR